MMKKTRLPSRRTFLRGVGVAVALPWLEATSPAAPVGGPRRLVAICTSLGLHAPFLFPEQAGRDYQPSLYLKELQELRHDFTIISGLSHPGVDGGHTSESSFLTAAPHPASGSFRNNISLDQLAAEQLGTATRFASLTLGTGTPSLSWTRAGVMIPPETSPARLFGRLFLEGPPAEKQAQVHRLRTGRSILEAVQEPAKRMQRDLGNADRDRLDEYFTSIRELEQRLNKAEEWTSRPRPKVSVPPPRDNGNAADLVGRTRLLYDLIPLILQTDSTRLITLHIQGSNRVPPIPGVIIDHHNLSHHGKDPEKIEQLKRIELEEVRALRDLLLRLKQKGEDGASLLDRTMVLFGSNLGNASSHDTHNLPILLAGGGFKHGQHLAFDPATGPPLCNLYVLLLRRLGLDVAAFGSSKGVLSGLEG